MKPDEIYIPVPGGRIFTLQWGEGPLLVFTHATGMCARVYTGLLAPLADRFRIVALDARGHGRTELPAIPGEIPADWALYRQDLTALVDALGGGPAVLAGHSFGATVSFEAAVETPGLARAVCLIDPPFIPTDHVAAYRAARDGGGQPPNHMADQAERRRGRFDSREAARASYQGRGVFRDWPDSALDDYLDGGLLPDPPGVRLACTPAWEATSFRGVSTTFAERLASARFPFTLLAAGEGSTVPESAEPAIRADPQATFRRFPGTGHFLAVTHADVVRPYIGALASGTLPDR
jgi:pimeloyl-ACP methyl ester carboxylesterase